MKFGENLKSLRKSFNITQEQLAEKVNVSRQSVSKWENSEAYPEMNNILELCKIFHCKITDLINDCIIDVDSLNEEVKMNVVKFKEDKQKKVKKISNIIYKGAGICKILFLLVIVYELCIFTFYGASLNKTSKTEEVLFSDSEKNVNIVEVKDDGVIKLKYNDLELRTSYDEKEMNTQRHIDKYGLTLTKVRFYIGFALQMFSLVFFYFILKNISKLFKNIKLNETPFSVVNTLLVKKIASIYILSIISGSLAGLLLNNVFPFEINTFNFVTIISALTIVCLYYIFDYGHEIQLDTNSKMYGEE